MLPSWSEIETKGCRVQRQAMRSLVASSAACLKDRVVIHLLRLSWASRLCVPFWCVMGVKWPRLQESENPVENKTQTAVWWGKRFAHSIPWCTERIAGEKAAQFFEHRGEPVSLWIWSRWMLSEWLPLKNLTFKSLWETRKNGWRLWKKENPKCINSLLLKPKEKMRKTKTQIRGLRDYRGPGMPTQVSF